MSIGNKIKQLRELRNFTQSYMANELGLSLSGYSKIERDATDISIKRLKQIAKILATDLSTLLNFDSNQVFNQYYNKTALANGIVQNQQVVANDKMDEFLKKMDEEIVALKEILVNLKADK